MFLFTLLFGIFTALGFFFLMTSVLKLPTLSTTRAMTGSGKKNIQLQKTVDVYLSKIAVKIGPFLPMDEFKKARLFNTLRAAGIPQTPEVYTTTAYLKATLIFLAVLPCLKVFPLLSPILAFLAVAMYFKEIKRAEELLREKREKIERDLPRFVATILQELKSSRDVLSMLEHYKRNASPTFAEELDTLCADMRSSSYEHALTRFETRINSPLLSDVVRGLIGVLRGDDSIVYFQMLAHDFKQLELQRLKAEALKIPPKIRIFSFLMLVCFLLTYLGIIAYEIITSLGGMF